MGIRVYITQKILHSNTSKWGCFLYAGYSLGFAVCYVSEVTCIWETQKDPPNFYIGITLRFKDDRLSKHIYEMSWVWDIGNSKTIITNKIKDTTDIRKGKVPLRSWAYWKQYSLFYLLIYNFLNICCLVCLCLYLRQGLPI